MLTRRAVLFVLFAVLAASVFATGTGETPAAEQEMVDYTAYIDASTVRPWFDNPNDVVTPYIEEKFGVHMSEVFWRSGMMTDQRLNTFLASDTLPDIFVASHTTIIPGKRAAMDLTELVPEYMPDYWNGTLTEADRQKSNDNGMIWWVYRKDIHNTTPEGLANPYDNGHGLPPLIREDILAELGYDFTPMAEIQATLEREQRAITMEDLAITPTPYETPEEFKDFLRDIAALELSDAQGNPVFPLSVRWGIQQLGGMFDFGTTWKWYPELGEAHGYLGAPGARDWLHWWWGAYNEGLIDPDYVIQKPEQLQEKIATGRAAMFLAETDYQTAQQSMLAIDPTWYIRPMPYPSIGEDHGYYYAKPPGFVAMFINKDLEESTAIRILEMWNWLNTDEGINVLCWGPEEAGLYTTNAEGNRVFTEPLMSIALQREANVEGGPEWYGVRGFAEHDDGSYWNTLVGNVGAAPKDSRGLDIAYSFPPMPNALRQGMRLLSAGQITSNPMVASDAGPAAVAAGTYWNSTFKYSEIARLLAAQNDAEFDDVWENYVMVRNEEEGRYSEAVEEMTAYFRNLGF